MSSPNKVPHTVLEKILKYLPPGDVKTCALVCSDWNDVISSSKSLMRRYKLTLKSVNSNILTTRRHRDIHIVYSGTRRKAKRSTIASSIDLSIVTDLTITSNIHTFDAKILYSLLKQTPLLETLNFNTYAFWRVHYTEALPINLPSLWKVEMDTGTINDLKVLKHINAPNITKLTCEVHGGNRRAIETDVDFLFQLIEDKQHLTDLKLSTGLMIKMNAKPLFRRKLKSLHLLSWADPFPDCVEQNLIELLTYCTNSITSLTIPFSFLSEKGLSIVFGGMKMLTKLVITDMNSYFKPIIVNHPLPNMNLKELYIQGASREAKSYTSAMLGYAPNIIKLEVMDVDNSLLQRISTCNKKLTHFCTTNVCSEVHSGDFTFNELILFDIKDRYPSPKFLSVMLDACPALKTLMLNTWPLNFNKDMVNKALHHQSIEYLMLPSEVELYLCDILADDDVKHISCKSIYSSFDECNVLTTIVDINNLRIGPWINKRDNMWIPRKNSKLSTWLYAEGLYG